ncbi:hypothetical protein [Lacisediminihabitans sp.]|uniref:hypothetical protein n=1 Tax=Lacisediminihabitans sp. TaxID=2787631 RepID=UPI002F95487B
MLPSLLASASYGSTGRVAKFTSKLLSMFVEGMTGIERAPFEFTVPRSGRRYFE